MVVLCAFSHDTLLIQSTFALHMPMSKLCIRNHLFTIFPTFACSSHTNHVVPCLTPCMTKCFTSNPTIWKSQPFRLITQSPIQTPFLVNNLFSLLPYTHPHANFNTIPTPSPTSSDASPTTHTPIPPLFDLPIPNVLVHDPLCLCLCLLSPETGDMRVGDLVPHHHFYIHKLYHRGVL